MTPAPYRSPDRLGLLRDAIREATLMDEGALARRLIDEADIGAAPRRAAQDAAAAFVRSARSNAARSGMIDKFLQEYGLTSHEGVTLMRLAEALLRTPDAATADALIRDKVEAGDWAAHKGRSPFPLVNFSTRALMLTAAWLDDVEARDPTGHLVKSTKAILDRIGDPVIRAAVAQAMKIMGEHFVLGETISEATRRGRDFARKGYRFSYDMLGEGAHTAADARKYFDDYQSAIAAIGREAVSGSVDDNPGISVKLSALHPRYEFAKRVRVRDELGAAVRALAIDAKAAGIGFNIDAEEANRLDLSLDLIEALARDPALAGWNGFGVVVQAYQRRAGFVIDWLAALAEETGRRIMVRLVKGAYWDSEIKRAQVMGLASYPVFTRKLLTDISYIACARKLLANPAAFYPQFATHNAMTAATVRAMAEGLVGAHGAFELQRLHGMGEALHDSLIADGAKSRIYAPVGGHRELLPYLVRRLLENGANSSFVNQLIDPDLSIDEVVADPVDEARTLTAFANPAIRAPRDLFGGERLAAEGADDTDPATAARLQRAVAADPDGVRRYQDAGTHDVRSIRNPARPAELVARVDFAGEAEAARAVEAAATFGAWSAVDEAGRANILRLAADRLEAQGELFMRLAVREAGKTIPDAIAELREAVDFLRYYAAHASDEGAPLGVVVCISPWNFPLAIFIGQVAAALAAGNAVIAKPAEQTPCIAIEAVRLLHAAGVPAEALQVLPGDGPTLGAALVRHARVAGVVFTGSTEVARIINRTLRESGRHDAALIAETGGINAMIIDSTALLEQAVRDVIASAFQSAGQRCSACRIVCVQEDIADRFCAMLAGAMAELAIGDPSQLETDVGPVIDAEAQAAILAHVAAFEASGRIIARAPEPAAAAAAGPAPDGGADDGARAGQWVVPTAVSIDRIGDVAHEVFGPVLHVMRYRAEALAGLVDEINASGYGLTLGIHTRIDETMHAISARARVGNIYVNRNQIGAVVGVQPFGGEGLSGSGPKAGGPHYVSALRRRIMPDVPRRPITIASGARAPLQDQLLKRLVAAQETWRLETLRRDVLLRALQAAGEDAAAVLRTAATLSRDAETAHELPGPTGESNTMRMRARGPALCLGPHPSALALQAAKAMAMGNAIICDGTLAAPLAAALSAAGASPDLVIGFPIRDTVPEALLSDPRIAFAVCDADDAAQARVAAALAARDGPITPLLRAGHDLFRFAVERTLTINTTAAGGDVRLLALSD